MFALYNFHEIRTPIFEETQLFARGVGEDTDIVSKEMFTWEDRARAQSEKSQSLTLRPENTAGVVRAYIEHKLGETGKLQKLYYIGPLREPPSRIYELSGELPPEVGTRGEYAPEILFRRREDAAWIKEVRSWLESFGFQDELRLKAYGESAFGLIPGFAYTAPFEDITIKGA